LYHLLVLLELQALFLLATLAWSDTSIVSLPWSRESPFFLSFIFLNTYVQLVMINDKKHGEGRNGFDNRECEDRQNCENIHSWMKSGCNYFRNVRVNAKRIGRSLFMFIVTTKRTWKWKLMSIEKRGVTKLWILKGIL
jgi:hypothetical protein